jgi:hypothetical protein
MDTSTYRYIQEGTLIMNPFTAVIDWLDEYADVAAPVGAFVGVAIAVAIAFILG